MLPSPALTDEIPRPDETSFGQSPGWLRAAILVGAIWALGMAVQVHEGFFTPRAIRFLVAALGLTILSLAMPRGLSRLRPLLDVAMAAAIGIQFYYLFSVYVGTLAITDPESERRALFNTFPKPDAAFLTPVLFKAGLALSAAMATLLLFSRRERVTSGAFLVIVATHLALGLGFVAHTAPPFSDVFLVQQEGAKAILAGKNPYAITIPNLFNVKPEDFPIDDQGRIAFGYGYPPLTLFLVLPSYVLTGDTRYANAVALTLAGALLGFIRPGRYAKLAAVLMLFSPRAFMILEIAFTDVFVILFFVATVFAAVRNRKGTPYLFGLFLAAKQYTILLPPLGMLLCGPRPTWRQVFVFLAKTMGTIAIVTIPLVILCWPQSRHSMIELPFRFNPLNQYMLTFPSWALWHYPREAALKLVPLAFLSASVVIGIAAFGAKRTPTNFCLAAGTAYFLFFAFNKQAYSQYYYLVIAMLSSGIAADIRAPGDPPVARDNPATAPTTSGEPGLPLLVPPA